MNDDDNEIAKAIMYAAKTLGTGNAASDMGAIEYLGSEVREAGAAIARAIDNLADALREHTDSL